MNQQRRLSPDDQASTLPRKSAPGAQRSASPGSTAGLSPTRRAATTPQPSGHAHRGCQSGGPELGAQHPKIRHGRMEGLCVLDLPKQLCRLAGDTRDGEPVPGSPTGGTKEVLGHRPQPPGRDRGSPPRSVEPGPFSDSDGKGNTASRPAGSHRRPWPR